MQQIHNLQQKFREKISACDICFMDYNRYDKQPIIICSNHHTICKQCLSTLHIKPQCPFCRQNIQLQKVVVNNYINQLLPNVSPQQNQRVRMNNSQPIRRNPRVNSVNQMQPQRVVIDYIAPYHQEFEFVQYIQYDGQDEPEGPEEQFDCNNCWDSIAKRLRIMNYGGNVRTTLYYMIFIAQFPFLFINIAIAFYSKDQACLDTYYQNGAYILRPWLMGIGIVEASFIIILFSGALLKVIQWIRMETLKYIQSFVKCIWIVKLLFWCYMQLILFFSVIKDHCHDGIYTYGLILTLLHIFCIVFVGLLLIAKS